MPGRTPVLPAARTTVTLKLMVLPMGRPTLAIESTLPEYSLPGMASKVSFTGWPTWTLSRLRPRTPARTLPNSGPHWSNPGW